MSVPSSFNTHIVQLRALVGGLLPAIALALGGCATQVNLPERPRLECPEPVVLCVPEKATTVSIDTASVAVGSFMTISRVRGLDGEGDELGVSFQWGRRIRDGIVTMRRRALSDSATDALLSARFLRVDQAVVADPVVADDLDGPVGGATASARNGTMVVASRRPEERRGDYDLFAGEFKDASIEKPKRLGVSAIGAWDAQPALSPDGTALYFASDRPGGLGGTDIWVTHRSPSGAWSTPENLGPGINTPCDELSPFVSGDGAWLYFASSGHATFGGYDLFRAPISRGEVGGAENLGAPINTPRDEIFPSAPYDASPDTLLYYSSNQIGSRGFDLYVLHRERRGSVAAASRRGEKARLSGTVTTTEGKPVDSALVTIEPQDAPAAKDSTFTDRRGYYEFEVERGKSYDVIAGSEKTLLKRETVKIPRSGGTVVSRNIPLPDTVTFRINFPFNDATDPYQFTLDDRGLPSNEQWSEVIDRISTFLRGTTRGGKVEIVGHTDPVGSDAFNLDLGRRRAEFVFRELTRRGVPPANLIVRSEGESQPLPPREGETEEIYHARLRRVELIRE